MCVVAIYKIGIGEGRHRERMRLIDIMSNIHTKNMLPEQRLHVIYVINYIVNRLRED